MLLRVCQDTGNEQELSGAIAVQVNMGVFSVQRGEGRLVRLNMLPAVCILSSLLKPAGLQPGSIMLPLSKPACEIGAFMLEPLLSAINSTQSCLDLH